MTRFLHPSQSRLPGICCHKVAVGESKRVSSTVRQEAGVGLPSPAEQWTLTRRVRYPPGEMDATMVGGQQADELVVLEDAVLHRSRP
jgi:hypothetical protein